MAHVCPYRGLRFFREEDAAFFFGRDAFTNRLFAAVDKHDFVAVVGASGSGKSSVARAGLVPLLRRKDGRRIWDVVTILPGNKPLQSLAGALIPLLEPQLTEVDRLREINKLAESLGSGEIALADVVSSAIEKQSGTDRLMLIVDQWEELYTLTTDEKIRNKFLDELLHATQSSPLSVVLTLRGEFFDQALAYRPLSDRLQDAVINIGRMTREELRETIELPAQKVGLKFEAGLVNRILDQVEGQAGNLPLLEFVLTELWKDRQEELITHESYEKLGEVQGAIASHAERALAAFSTSEQEVARRIFLRLVSIGSESEDETSKASFRYTRRRATFAELGQDSLPVVRKLSNSHLIVTGRNDATGEETVDIVHEALIKEWGRLQKWIDDDRQFLLWRERLRTLVDISAASNYDKSTQLRGRMLVEAQEWQKQRPNDLSAREQKFIHGSVKSVRRVRLLYVGIALGSIALALAGVGIYRWAGESRPVEISRSSSPTPEPESTVTERTSFEGVPRKHFSLNPPSDMAVVFASIDTVPFSGLEGGEFSTRFAKALHNRVADKNADKYISIAEATDLTAQLLKTEGIPMTPACFGSGDEISLSSGPFEAEPRYKRVHALLIGIEEYSADVKFLGVIKDINRFQELLESDGEALAVSKLTNAQAVKSQIIQTINAIKAKSTTDDLMVVYFSGHVGFEDAEKEPALIPYDFAKSKVPLSELINLVQEVKAKHRLIIIDG